MVSPNVPGDDAPETESGRLTFASPTIAVVTAPLLSQPAPLKSAVRVLSGVVLFSPMVKVAGSVVSFDALLSANVAPAKVMPKGPSASVPPAGPLISRPSTNDVAESRSYTGLDGDAKSISTTKLKFALGFTVTWLPVKSVTPGMLELVGRPSAERLKFNCGVVSFNVGVKLSVSCRL